VRSGGRRKTIRSLKDYVKKKTKVLDVLPDVNTQTEETTIGESLIEASF